MRTIRFRIRIVDGSRPCGKCARALFWRVCSQRNRKRWGSPASTWYMYADVRLRSKNMHSYHIVVLSWRARRNAHCAAFMRWQQTNCLAHAATNDQDAAAHQPEFPILAYINTVPSVSLIPSRTGSIAEAMCEVCMNYAPTCRRHDTHLCSNMHVPMLGVVYGVNLYPLFLSLYLCVWT